MIVANRLFCSLTQFGSVESTIAGARTACHWIRIVAHCSAPDSRLIHDSLDYKNFRCSPNSSNVLSKFGEISLGRALRLGSFFELAETDPDRPVETKEFDRDEKEASKHFDCQIRVRDSKCSIICCLRSVC